MFIAWGATPHLALQRRLHSYPRRQTSRCARPFDGPFWSQIWSELGLLNEAVAASRSPSRTKHSSPSATPQPLFQLHLHAQACSTRGRWRNLRSDRNRLDGAAPRTTHAPRAPSGALAESKDASRIGHGRFQRARSRDRTCRKRNLIWQPGLRVVFGTAGLVERCRWINLFAACIRTTRRWSPTHSRKPLQYAGSSSTVNVEYRARWETRRRPGSLDCGQGTRTARTVRANGTAMDITSRKTTELALEMALEASRAAASGHPDNRLTWDGTLDGHFGLRPGEAVRSLDQFIALVHPDHGGGDPPLRALPRSSERGSMEFRVTRMVRVHWLYDPWPDPPTRSWPRRKTMTGACVNKYQLCAHARGTQSWIRQKDELPPRALRATRARRFRTRACACWEHQRRPARRIRVLRQFDHMVHLHRPPPTWPAYRWQDPAAASAVACNPCSNRRWRA